MTRRSAAAVVAVAVGTVVLNPLAATPAAAEITSGFFDCGSTRIDVGAPSYQFRGPGAEASLWWTVQYYKWNGTEFVPDAGGEYHYNTQGGAPHAWRRYPAGDQGGSQGLTAPGGYYAVLHWIYAEGQWHWYWAQNADLNTGPQPESTYWCRT